jgi:hypothetical protein
MSDKFSVPADLHAVIVMLLMALKEELADDPPTDVLARFSSPNM